MSEQHFDRLSDEVLEGHIRGSRSGSVKISTRSWLRAADIMSTDVATISLTDTLISAAKTMS